MSDMKAIAERVIAAGKKATDFALDSSGTVYRPLRDIEGRLIDVPMTKTDIQAYSDLLREAPKLARAYLELLEKNKIYEHYLIIMRDNAVSQWADEALEKARAVKG